MHKKVQNFYIYIQTIKIINDIFLQFHSYF